MHLLATETGTLDEIATAVDLEQSPADIVVLSFSDSDLSALAAAWSAHRDRLPSLRLASLKQLRHPMSVDLYIDRVAAHARAIIVRSLGGLDYWRYGFERLADTCRRTGAHFIALPGDDRADPRLAELSTVRPDELTALDTYFRAGGVENVGNALRFTASLIGQNRGFEAAKSIDAAIGVAADGATFSLDSAEIEDGGRPIALIVFYRASLLAADTAPIVALSDGLAARGLRPLAIAVTSLKDPEANAPLARLLARVRPAVIVNATAFSALRADETSVLDEADCPVLQVALSGATHDAWQASARGLSPSDLAMNVVLPELDGRIFTRAISFKAERVAEPDLQHASIVHAPEPSRVAFVADLAAGWARLSQTPRRTRRVALMLSDYPARRGRTGYACGLDTFESVIEILQMLRDAGYDTGSGDRVASDIVASLTQQRWVSGQFTSINSPPPHPKGRGADGKLVVAIEAYRSMFAALPLALAAEIAAAWGAPDDDPAFHDGAFHFPCVRAGNVLVLLQPDRGSTDDRKRGYHDLACPPRHAYVALYAALREIERIDALVHVGTHGTLEWLPGKALALSQDCAPEAVLGAVPVIYPFIVNNPGEAVQAKRRICAVTIGHLTPPLCEAGLHGPLAELEALIEEYSEADGIDRRRIPLLEAEILERAWRSGLAADCGLDGDAPPRAQIARLDAQLCDIKDLAIRDRLHVFGRSPEPESLAMLAATVARGTGGDGDIEAIASLLRASAAAERVSLIGALDGRRVAPGPAGAPTRGRRDVLPTGRNLTTVDPRAVPTRTAATIGRRAAEEVIRRHLQNHGDYPRALMLDIWASATLRTGGDDIAQALHYLGCRPVWDASSNRVTGVEVLPLAALSRPRIDVTLRLSGLFRDIFASQIALFDLAVEMVAHRDEDDADNPLAAARRRGESLSRAFGNAPGSYGAGTAERALDTDWSSRDDLAEAYLAASAYAYGRNDDTREARGEFAERVAHADALVHPQDDRERDILDGDGVADFVGGFAAAAAQAGRTPSLYHLDTSKPEAPVSRTIAEEITRIVRGRLINPRWIAGMLSHGHRGVAEMAQGVDALYAFAVAARAVPPHLFDAVHDALLGDERTRAALIDANPAAAEAIAARLADAIARGLWTPRRNAVHAELARLAPDGSLEAAQ